MPYAAPLTDMRLALDALGSLTGEAAELAGPVLDEAARFAAAELDPLNLPGDRTGSVLENGVVRTPPGFRAAYQQYIEGGWMGLVYTARFTPKVHKLVLAGAPVNIAAGRNPCGDSCHLNAGALQQSCEMDSRGLAFDSGIGGDDDLIQGAALNPL